jgi:hypothetical protein
VLVGMHVWETISQENVRYILNHNDLDRFQPVKFYILRGQETLYGHLTIDPVQVQQVARQAVAAVDPSWNPNSLPGSGTLARPPAVFCSVPAMMPLSCNCPAAAASSPATC